MEKLLSYGSLQSSKIQYKLFNRILSGKVDVLIDYDKDIMNIEGESFYSAYFKLGSRIDGKLYELSSNELIITDIYEGNLYKRIKVKLKSGINAWVYIHV